MPEEASESPAPWLRPPSLRRHPLDPFFRPQHIAIFGAAETPCLGRTLLSNLVGTAFGGQVSPIHAERESILGLKAYPRLADLPQAPDLAVIATPAATVPGLVGECADAGVPAVAVLSPGFRELGPGGVELERRILAQARRGHLRVLGPNTLGVMCPPGGLNATCAAAMARAGHVAFLSQSDALCTAVLDWSLREQVGFSAFVSVGGMVDVNWGDLVDYLGNDPHTSSIVIYMETVGDARAFLSAAREVALAKPILVMKSGRSAAAAKAAASHTGALTGSDEALDAAFRHVGLMRVNCIADLFFMAEVLSKQPLPKGRRLAIVTNAGGPGVIATDSLVYGGGELAPLAPATHAALNLVLPPHWSHNNPVDLQGEATPEQYAQALDIVARDPGVDGLLVVLAPQERTDPTRTAEALKPHFESLGKPVLASWMGGPLVEAGRAVLQRAGVPLFEHPDDACHAFNYLWKYSANLRGLYEVPSLRTLDLNGAPASREQVRELIASVHRSGRTLLTSYESLQLLAAYGIPTLETRVAANEDEAAAAAAAFGYPVALKLLSQTLTHKADVGGVKLYIQDEVAVRAAFREIEANVAARAGEGHFLGVTVQPMIESPDHYDVILGSSLDPQLGPILLFGAGGSLVEVLRDRALSLPPLNPTLARRMMEQTRIYQALRGVRGRRPVDLAALEHVLVSFSQLVAEQRWIRECDINPLFAAPGRVVALDARVVLHPASFPEEQLPRCAIRPYPVEHVSEWNLRDGRPITIRPIRPEDEVLMVHFHQGLSDRTVRQRFLHDLGLDDRVSHQRLMRKCFNDFDREMALVAERRDAATGQHEILGIGRLSRVRWSNDAELALLIADAYQGQGLGARLVELLLAVGRTERLGRVYAEMLPENAAMRKVCEDAGFTIIPTDDGALLQALLDLGRGRTAQ